MLRLFRVVIASVAMMMCVFGMTSPASAQIPVWLQSIYGAPLIVMGGTDDPQAETQLARVGSWTLSDKLRPLPYPASFGPLVGSLSYDDSVAGGVHALQQTLLHTEMPVVVASFSQGGRVIGDVANVMDTPENAAKVKFVTLSDPRMPGSGIEAELFGTEVLGATARGSRPATQHVEYTSVCIVGDPVCAGIGHPANVIPGFVCIHGDKCPGNMYHYNNLENLEVVARWQDDATEYIVLAAPHPWEIVASAAGLQLSATQRQALHAALPVGVPDMPVPAGEADIPMVAEPVAAPVTAPPPVELPQLPVMPPPPPELPPMQLPVLPEPPAVKLPELPPPPVLPPLPLELPPLPTVEQLLPQAGVATPL